MQEKDVGISKGDINMEEKIVKVLNVMSEYLSIAQMKKLQEVILQTFAENEAEKLCSERFKKNLYRSANFISTGKNS